MWSKSIKTQKGRLLMFYMQLANGRGKKNTIYLSVMVDYGKGVLYSCIPDSVSLILVTLATT